MLNRSGGEHMSGQEPSRRRLIYGRRQGHKLRDRQRHLMEELLPRLAVDIRSRTDVLPAGAGRRPLWLEIGFGGGEHLAWQAAHNPGVDFIGCEPFINGVAKLLSSIDECGLTNIRIHDDDARDVLDWLPDASVERVFLLYPDPWHKVRHHKRRFVSPENLDRLARVMTDDGTFRFSSDIPDNVRWTLAHVRRHGAFRWTANRPADWRDRPSDWPQTRYEVKALEAGRSPCYLTFRREQRQPVV